MIFIFIAIAIAGAAAWFLSSEFGGGGNSAPAPGAAPSLAGSAPGDTTSAAASSPADSALSTLISLFSQTPTPPSAGAAAAPISSSGPGPAVIEQWRPLAEKYASINSILNPEEILAIIWNESTGNPEASNPKDPSVGLMGVTLLIGRAYAGATTLEQLYDPDLNVKAGAGFLAQLKQDDGDQFPITDPNIAWVAGYNEGEPNLRKRRPDPAYISGYLNHLAALGGTPQ
jgi:soluble lytic murein transglycosylase-like protein